MFLLRGSFRFLLPVVFFTAWVLTDLRLEQWTFAFLASFLVYCLWLRSYFAIKQNTYLHGMVEGFCVLLLAGWIATLIHMQILTIQLAEIDRVLLATDLAIGFDWKIVTEWILERPYVSITLQLAYASLLVQLIIVIAILSSEKHKVDRIRFLNAYAATLLTSVTLAALLPAHAMCRTAGLEFDANGPLAQSAGCAFLPVYDAIRNGALTEIALRHIDGLATFPSFHTTCAILFTWFVRQVAGFRWVFLILNVLMIAATPTFGGHYLTDVLAGGVIALAGIAMTAERKNRLISEQLAFMRAIFTRQTVP